MKVYIDCTHTEMSGLRTGVQRVVRSVTKESKTVGRELGIDCLPVVFQAGEMHALDKVRQKAASTQPIDVLAKAPKAYRFLANVLCSTTKNRKLKKWLLPEPGHLGIFRFAGYRKPRFDRFSSRDGGDQNAASVVTPDHGDLILLPDAYWAFEEIWDVIAQYREAGVKIATVLYDFIPLTHPHFVPRSSTVAFERYLRNLAEHSDLVLAISNTVRVEALACFPDLFPHRTGLVTIDSFRLGAEFAECDSTPSADVRELFSGHRSESPYLMVATFDPRKNHAYLLESFELLWEKGVDKRLCFVGGRGWMSEELLERIEKHPELNRRLFVFHNMSDTDLRFCYEHARGVVCPSFVEGFGLPIVESLYFGNRTFASDIPIHREVGERNCVYFNLSDPADLCQKIMQAESELSIGTDRSTKVRKPINWRESTRQLLEKCAAMQPQWNALDARVPA